MTPKTLKQGSAKMPTEQFTIPRRPAWSFLGSITVSIECDPLAPQPIKLGLAVRAAATSGANLSGANLSGANLSGANLSGADLSGANLYGAKVHDEPVKRLFASVQRINDPYAFHAFEMEAGGVKILAGCQWRTVESYREHVEADYPDEPKGQETRDILAFIEARARALEIALVATVAEAA